MESRDEYDTDDPHTPGVTVMSFKEFQRWQDERQRTRFKPFVYLVPNENLEPLVPRDLTIEF